MLIRAFGRIRAAAIPYRLGDRVVGDDPFIGRVEGIVSIKEGSSIGLQVTRGEATRTVFYDYRQLRPAD